MSPHRAAAAPGTAAGAHSQDGRARGPLALTLSSPHVRILSRAFASAFTSPPSSNSSGVDVGIRRDSGSLMHSCTAQTRPGSPFWRAPARSHWRAFGPGAIGADCPFAAMNHAANWYLQFNYLIVLVFLSIACLRCHAAVGESVGPSLSHDLVCDRQTVARRIKSIINSAPSYKDNYLIIAITAIASTTGHLALIRNNESTIIYYSWVRYWLRATRLTPAPLFLSVELAIRHMAVHVGQRVL